MQPARTALAVIPSVCVLVATVAAAAGAGAGCRCGGGGSQDGGGGGSSDAAVDAGAGSADAGGASDSGTLPPECLVGLISDDATANLTPVFALLDAMTDVGYDHMPDNTTARFTENAALIGAFDVVVWYQHNRLISTAEHDTLEAWLQGGGRLLVTGHDSLGDPDDPLLAALVRSATVGDVVGVTDFTITDGTHPIATGPYGAHGTGEAVTTPTNDIDAAEADTAAGAVTVAAYTDGHDKIIATALPGGGVVVYWNGNGQDMSYVSPDWGAGQTAMREMFQNAVAWMCGP
ncbi:MAG TPA: hypothetical protein VG389_00950 [Myxococcota bacterium]|jgi:hypothetical protein|nr:hypothetical protein [Myxococcota bacterium]